MWCYVLAQLKLPSWYGFWKPTMRHFKVKVDGDVTCDRSGQLSVPAFVSLSNLRKHKWLAFERYFIKSKDSKVLYTAFNNSHVGKLHCSHSCPGSDWHNKLHKASRKDWWKVLPAWGTDQLHDETLQLVHNTFSLASLHWLPMQFWINFWAAAPVLATAQAGS